MSASPASPWREALAAARVNLVPGLVLQAFALCLVVAYFFHAPTHEALNALAHFKSRWGLIYSSIATAVCGGLVPFLYMRANRRTRWFNPWPHLLFHVGFWAYKGIEVDLFYRSQGWLFGNAATFSIIAKKVLVDQLVYNVFWAMPTAVLVFHWKDTGFGFARMRGPDLIGFWKANLPKALFGAWGVWLPAVCIIYSLPAALQIPLFNIVLCFYALLFASLSARKIDTQGR